MEKRVLMSPGPRQRRRRRWMEMNLEEDPLSLLVNFFDCSIVFALAFMVTLLASSAASAPGRPVLERLRKDRVKLERFRATEQSIGGEGERLGTAYRLSTGEVVYVPDDRPQ